MNPQCGYYQSPRPQNYGSFGNNQSGYKQQSFNQCGSGVNCFTRRPGNEMYSSSTRMQQPPRSTSTYGYSSGQGSSPRVPPTFQSSVQSRANVYRSTPQNGYNSAQSSCNVNGRYRQQQRIGRSVPCSGNDYKLGYQQPQMRANQRPLAPVPYCTPQAIKVNVTAEQLENARNTPYQDRGDTSLEGNPGAKYIQLNWQDLLGGMDNLRVSMAPSSDPCNQNQQLKVSFGAQKTDPPQAGETSLRVVSIEPVNTGRMDIQKGNALAGSMKICNSPITNVAPMQTGRASPSCTRAGNARYNK